MNETELREETFYEGLRTGLGMPSWKILGGNLAPNMSDELSHDSNDVVTNNFVSGLSYQKKLNKYFASSLSYSFSLTQTNQSATAGTSPTDQRFSLNLTGSHGKLWNLQLYSSYSLEEQSLFGTASTTYYLPWLHTHGGHHPIYLQYNGSITTGTTTVYSHLLSLGIALGAYTVVIHYSPTGNTELTGFSASAGEHWSFELVRAGW